MEPADLRAALDADPARRRVWNTWARPARLAVIEWIEMAREPVTRAERVARAVSETVVDPAP